jgi:uncharacterized protein (DUF433 family)
VPKLKFDVQRVAQFSDSREMPAYSIAEASHYLRIPAATVRAWVLGTTTTNRGERRVFHHVIELPIKGLAQLSFFNLAEILVLRSLRERYEVKLDHIRRALAYVRSEMGWTRPLIQKDFRTDGVRLFVKKLGRLIDVVDPQQALLPGVMDNYLKRIDWENELAARLYPFTRTQIVSSAPRSVVIDPQRSFGRPVVARLGVTTSIIFERYQAGDARQRLADEYGATEEEIDEAIRCEAPSAIAA